MELMESHGEVIQPSFLKTFRLVICTWQSLPEQQTSVRHCQTTCRMYLHCRSFQHHGRQAKHLRWQAQRSSQRFFSIHEQHLKCQLCNECRSFVSAMFKISFLGGGLHKRAKMQDSTYDLWMHTISNSPRPLRYIFGPKSVGSTARTTSTWANSIGEK